MESFEKVPTFLFLEREARRGWKMNERFCPWASNIFPLKFGGVKIDDISISPHHNFARESLKDHFVSGKEFKSACELFTESQ